MYYSETIANSRAERRAAVAFWSFRWTDFSQPSRRVGARDSVNKVFKIKSTPAGKSWISNASQREMAKIQAGVSDVAVSIDREKMKLENHTPRTVAPSSLASIFRAGIFLWTGSGKWKAWLFVSFFVRLRRNEGHIFGAIFFKVEWISCQKFYYCLISI